MIPKSKRSKDHAIAYARGGVWSNQQRCPNAVTLAGTTFTHWCNDGLADASRTVQRGRGLLCSEALDKCRRSSLDLDRRSMMLFVLSGPLWPRILF